MCPISSIKEEIGLSQPNYVDGFKKGKIYQMFCKDLINLVLFILWIYILTL